MRVPATDPRTDRDPAAVAHGVVPAARRPRRPSNTFDALSCAAVRSLATPTCLAVLLAAACDERTTAKPRAEAGTPAEMAPSEHVAPRAPPPLRAPRIAAPALPDLPTLAAHEPPGTPPPGATADPNPCHAVWTGTSSAPLACIKSKLFFDQSGSAQRLVPRTLLHHEASVLPPVVDHRQEGTEGPVRDQLSAPACTAFATAAALDHALARWGGGNPAVSVMQIWARYHSPEVVTSLTSNVGQQLGAENNWPFRVSDAVSWVSCSDFSRPPREGCGHPVDQARLRAVTAASLGEFTEVEYIGNTADTIVLEAKIAAGQDVMVTIEPPSAMVPRGQPGSRYVPDYSKSAGPGTGHTLLLAGYAHFSHGTYFLVHNSWGAGWGDGGFAWMHEETLHHWSLEVVAIDAEPFLRTVGSRPVRQRAQQTCEAGLVPDSIRASCAQPCPDHSPRHDGVCPVANQCPAGFVNLTGACVLSAPTLGNKDPQTGIAWTCGPGGCSYVLPKSADPACTGSVCQASCPAPDFILARMGSELVCIE
jgi:hypothetical protein